MTCGECIDANAQLAAAGRRGKVSITVLEDGGRMVTGLPALRMICEMHGLDVDVVLDRASRRAESAAPPDRGEDD